MKLAAKKLPGAVKKMWSVSFDLSLAVGSLKVTFHSLPFLPSTASTLSCLMACQDVVEALVDDTERDDGVDQVVVPGDFVVGRKNQRDAVADGEA